MHPEKSKSEDIQSKILYFLKNEKHGASISEIARSINVSRITLSKYLETMRAQGLVNFKSIGMAKLWRLGSGSANSMLLEELLFHVLPEKFKQIDEENAYSLNVETTKELLINTLTDCDSVKESLNNKESYIDMILYCYTYAGLPDAVFEYKIVKESDDDITLEITSCPHIKYTKNNPLACSACEGVKRGILESIFGILSPTFTRYQLISEGADSCIFSIPKSDMDLKA